MTFYDFFGILFFLLLSSSTLLVEAKTQWMSRSSTPSTNITSVVGAGSNWIIGPTDCTSDTSRDTTATMYGASTTNVLLFQNWGFDIPFNATIQAIQVTVTRDAANDQSGDSIVQLRVNSNASSSDTIYPSWSGSSETATYPSWQILWNATYINDNSFGFAFAVSSTGDDMVSISCVEIDVQYYMPDMKNDQPATWIGAVAAVGGFTVAVALFIGLACFIRRYRIPPEKSKLDIADAEKNVRIKKVKKKKPEQQSLTAARSSSNLEFFSMMPASIHNQSAMTARFNNNNSDGSHSKPAIKITESPSDSDNSNIDTVTYHSVELTSTPTHIYQTLSNSQWNISFNEIVLEREIGRGAFGVVYKGTWRSNYVAIKKMGQNAMSKVDFDNFLKEIEVMKNLKPCGNVVQLLAVCENPFCLVIEYCEKGNLYDLLRKEKEMPTETQRKIVMGIAKGMMHLHEEHIIHRDLAARNVLLTGSLEPKVSDFGMSKSVVDVEGVRGKSGVGPLRWMAPESIREHVYSPATDVWAFGITLVEIITKDDPYPDADIFTVASKVSTGELVHPIPDFASAIMRKLITKCLSFEPDVRPSFTEIVHFLEKNTENW